MNKSLLSILILITATFGGVSGIPAAADARELSDATLELMRKQIRRDKFDHVLPQAMRDNGVDMWIHVIRDRNPDGLASEMGGKAESALRAWEEVVEINPFIRVVHERLLAHYERTGQTEKAKREREVLLSMSSR